MKRNSRRESLSHADLKVAYDKRPPRELFAQYHRNRSTRKQLGLKSQSIEEPKNNQLNYRGDISMFEIPNS